MRRILTFSLTVLMSIAMAADGPRALKIFGEIDPEFDVELRVIYQATKNSWFCKYTVNWLEGASSVYNETKIHNISSKSGRYEVQIPLEEVDPQKYCRYRPFSIEYTIRDHSTGYSSGVGGGRPVLLWYTSDGHEIAMPQDIRCRFMELKGNVAPPLKGLICHPTWERFAPRTAERYRHVPLLKESVNVILANFLHEVDTSSERKPPTHLRYDWAIERQAPLNGAARGRRMSP